MAQDNKPQQPQPQRHDDGRPLTEERGLPPVKETPIMPKVKPPKQSN